PNVAGERATKVQIVAYSVILAATSLVPSFIGMSGWLYTAVAVVTGASFLYLALRLYRADGTAMKKVARSLFTYSLSYLAVIFFALMTDHIAQLVGWL
ncbi:MAG: protoheme IX farnesyltransferase, partial [Devosia sp.]|nr:protoheme IX farnesyltransferase [Devosia sp.]